MTLKIKVYNKSLALLQSRTSIKTLGMNTTKIFSSKGIQKGVLKESQETGLCRIEVSYRFKEAQAFQEFFLPNFQVQAQQTIIHITDALQSVPECFYRVPMLRMLEKFQ